MLVCLYILCKGPFPSLFVYLGSRRRRLVLLVLMFPLMLPERPQSATPPGLAHPHRIPPASPSPNCLNFPLPQWRTRCLLVSPWQGGKRNTDLPQAFSNFVLRAIQSLILRRTLGSPPDSEGTVTPPTLHSLDQKVYFLLLDYP